MALFLEIKIYGHIKVCLLMTIPNRKMDAPNFDTVHDILRCLSLVQSLLKGRNAPIWRIGNQEVNMTLISLTYLIKQNFLAISVETKVV